MGIPLFFRYREGSGYYHVYMICLIKTYLPIFKASFILQLHVNCPANEIKLNTFKFRKRAPMPTLIPNWIPDWT